MIVGDSGGVGNDWEQMEWFIMKFDDIILGLFGKFNICIQCACEIDHYLINKFLAKNNLLLFLTGTSQDKRKF